jgi:hypothetical protein
MHGLTKPMTSREVPAPPRKLKPRELAFARYIIQGATNHTKAAELAGYPSKSARQRAWELMRDKDVQSYIDLHINALQLPRAAIGAQTIEDLALNAEKEAVRLAAAKDLLDRAGYKAPDKHLHLHDGNLSINIDLS